ncbi:hypothetical protein KI387_003339, partial [Taxus chinensis]
MDFPISRKKVGSPHSSASVGAELNLAHSSGPSPPLSDHPMDTSRGSDVPLPSLDGLSNNLMHCLLLQEMEDVHRASGALVSLIKEGFFQ